MTPALTHPLDEQLAALLQRLGGTADVAGLRALVKYVSERTRNGVIAAPLAGLPGVDPAALQADVVGEPGDYKPIIVSATHAWLYRYWQYEERLAKQVRQRLTQGEGVTGIPALWIISGGPGTGKTTRVTRLMADLLAQGVRSERILLAAPTGKAAMRMLESIRDTRERLQLPVEIAEQLPTQARTLHRLLGYIPNRVGFRHHAQHPLPADVVIVDEASMIDISLMTHLFEAVSPTARLILLGDKDQLASVETGSIFRDLCEAPALQAHRQVLQRSYRFSESDGVGQLAQAIRAADETRLLAVLAAEEFPSVSWDESGEGLQAQWLQDGWQAYVSAVQAGDVAAVFQAFNDLRILTPLRQGRLGVEGLNPWVDNVMQRLLPTHAGALRPWYVGRPVMVTQNDYRQELFNGDIGIALPDAQGVLRVWFPTAQAGEFRAVAPIRLPAHETAWAMTIHKSQGSEFTRVLLLLPDVEDSPLLGRELLYTAVTRAKQGIHVIASRATLQRALQQVMPPASCLQEKLFKPSPQPCS
ncbi:exodeoxyribonuclease V subunit alpha [Candidatus Thiothrix anitrata]|uniref:RecBCD enzyme subunit RecD n=1 Tax=Candidatus Thiothrix anitrata TaxID=2823902 RepID=A0ABX7X2F6_9GAMM|nr:exodeoxyribonuclease V subunit alpha [Candidatus Thiothrix anitrata]QTR49926.1 exodeoxyribonuclease V subunit alpha [Candidatus Thiothrix anitrata]